MGSTRLSGVRFLTSPRVPAARAGGALHLIVSRSSAVRLAPVIAALEELGVQQRRCEFPGAPARPADLPPQTVGALAGLSPAAVDAAVDAALSDARPAFVLVAGDGETAVAAVLAATRHDVPIARVGAGLRCDDRGIEGEVNRLVIDELAARLYTDGAPAAARLRTEGAEETRIRNVGSTLPDAVARWLQDAAGARSWESMGLPRQRYALVTLHKPENVADQARLAGIADALRALARRVRVVLCLDPRRRDTTDPIRGLESLRAGGVRLVAPLDYPSFLSLLASAGAVVTDSAGVQEETTVLGVPCYTVARASERTLTLTHGTNVLLGEDPASIADISLGAFAQTAPIPLWDGDAGRRIAADLSTWNGAG